VVAAEETALVTAMDEEEESEAVVWAETKAVKPRKAEMMTVENFIFAEF